MRKPNLDKYVNEIIEGKYDLSVGNGRGRGDDGEGDVRSIQLSGYPLKDMKSRSATYHFGFSISPCDPCTGSATIRFSDRAFYGNSVKEIFSDLIKSSYISKRSVYDLICYLVLKFGDASASINEWIPNEIKNGKGSKDNG